MRLPYLLAKPIARLVVSSANRNPRFRARLATIEGERIALKAKGCSKPFVFVIEDERLKGPLASSGKAGAVISASPWVLWKIFRGQLDADAAFFQRKIEVQGRLAVALTLKNALDELVG